MKKNLTLLAAIVFAAATSFAQQMDYWFMAPQKIKVQSSIVTTTAIAGNPATAMQIANGFYDNTANGNLVFYVADGGVYDYNNTLIGTIPHAGGEVAIVPFDDNDNANTSHCKRKYNIFTTGGANGFVALYQSVLDMNSFSLKTILPAINTLPYGLEFGALAVGKFNTTTKQRFLYFLAGSGTGSPTGQINKLVINSDGSVNTAATAIYPNASVPDPLAGINVFARELDLSPDGLWLGWASFAQINLLSNNPTLKRYHYVKLDANGNFDLSFTPVSKAYQEFNIDVQANWPHYENYNVPGFRGVEFYQANGATKLFVGAGNNGIFSVDVALPYNINQAPKIISGSNPDYGYSQIEKAKNDYMYASSANNDVKAFEPFSANPIMLGPTTGFNFSSPPFAPYNLGGANPNTKLYTLPYQIDGEDYSSITGSPLPQVITVNSYLVDNTGAVNVIWTSGSGNPWSTSSFVQVINELRIKDNRNLTINNMTFKFGPDAKVIIEPGSTLTLNDTTFTSDYMGDPCYNKYTWTGVQVWGTKTASQITTPLAQGKLTINSGSKIEYAQWGARTYDGASLSTSGGIIIGNSASFVNCSIGVEFKPYDNFRIVNGVKQIISNKSSFTSVNFTNDAKYPFATASTGASIDACAGIIFSNSSFNNSTDPILLAMQSAGIKSLDANYTVTKNSIFQNYYRGIDAKRVNANAPFYISQSKFSANQTGIYTSLVNSFSILSNHKSVGNGFYIGNNV